MIHMVGDTVHAAYRGGHYEWGHLWGGGLWMIHMVGDSVNEINSKMQCG